jgi:hypothetical protein
MSILKKSSMEILNDVGLCQEKEDALFKNNCPHCYSETKYRTKNVGSREKEKNWVEKD